VFRNANPPENPTMRNTKPGQAKTTPKRRGDARPAVAATGAMQRVRARKDRPEMRPDLPMRKR